MGITNLPLELKIKEIETGNILLKRFRAYAGWECFFEVDTELKKYPEMVKRVAEEFKQVMYGEMREKIRKLQFSILSEDIFESNRLLKEIKEIIN